MNYFEFRKKMFDISPVSIPTKYMHGSLILTATTLRGGLRRDYLYDYDRGISLFPNTSLGLITHNILPIVFIAHLISACTQHSLFME